MGLLKSFLKKEGKKHTRLCFLVPNTEFRRDGWSLDHEVGTLSLVENLGSRNLSL